MELCFKKTDLEIIVRVPGDGYRDGIIDIDAYADLFDDLTDYMRIPLRSLLFANLIIAGEEDEDDDLESKRIAMTVAAADYIAAWRIADERMELMIREAMRKQNPTQ